MGELFSQYNVLGAFGITIVLTVLSALGALVIGTLVAIMRVSPVGFLNKLGALYVNLVRNTPLTLIIVFCNIGFIVNLGMSVSDDFARNNLVWATIGLAFYHAAFVCEALRSGVNTVP
ncbi:MAG TPA: ABC transporter permease subunit, partial [Dermatophilaceae bacterium]|nr:ABC transporter permease subunit [Dermatophilaceae bacterium]